MYIFNNIISIILEPDQYFVVSRFHSITRLVGITGGSPSHHGRRPYFGRNFAYFEWTVSLTSTSLELIHGARVGRNKTGFKILPISYRYTVLPKCS